MRFRRSRKRREPSPPPSTSVEQSGGQAAPARRRGWMVVAMMLATLAGGMLVFGAFALTGDDNPAAAETASDFDTAAIETRDLIEYTDLNGTLGFPDAISIASGAEGALTNIAGVGNEIGRGDTLYEINDVSVVLLYGDSPAWRELSTASTPGEDIRQLEENLVALGYDPDGEIEIDTRFDAATAEAVKRWEPDLGVDPDGIVQLGSVVFLPNGVQVSKHLLMIGTGVAPNVAVLEVLPTREIETITGRYPYDVELGIISDLLATGTPIERGQVLYRYAVDDGVDWTDDIFTRELSVSSTAGEDIQQLEENLVALGYDPLGKMTIDETFDEATAAAVTRWEEDLGITINGVVELEQFEQAESAEPVPVVAMYGSTPITRQLSTTSAPSEDIRQLEENLVALGYDPAGEIEVDQTFDEATAAAVERWEEDLGIEADGIVDAGQVVMVPEETQVSDVFVEGGDSVALGEPIMEASASARVITTQLAVDNAGILSEGDEVEIELPDGTTASGRVIEIGQTAYVDEASQSGEAVVDATIALGTVEGEIELTVLPVEIHVATERAEGVMAVPVSALLALAEGGYAVELVEGQTTRLVAVETGMYADGWVEITGEGLSEGMSVVVPG